MFFSHFFVNFLLTISYQLTCENIFNLRFILIFFTFALAFLQSFGALYYFCVSLITNSKFTSTQCNQWLLKCFFGNFAVPFLYYFNFCFIWKSNLNLNVPFAFCLLPKFFRDLLLLILLTVLLCVIPDGPRMALLPLSPWCPLNN